MGVKVSVVGAVSLGCHVVRCAVHKTRVGRDSRADDVGLLTFVPCACANALLRPDWRGGGVDRGRALKTRRANCGVSRFGVGRHESTDQGAGVQWEAGRAPESNGRWSPAPSPPPFLLHHPHCESGSIPFFALYILESTIASILPPGIPAYLIVALGACYCEPAVARFVQLLFASSWILASSTKLELDPISTASLNHTTPRLELRNICTRFFARFILPGLIRVVFCC